MTSVLPDASDDTRIERLREVCEQIRAQTADLVPRGVRHDDADGVVGTFATDDAMGFDPFPMLALMRATKADFAVFGQVAGILHGSRDPTGDLDILWDGNPASVDVMARAFDSAGVRLRNENFDEVEPSDYRAALHGLKVYFEGLGCAGDLCTTRLPWGSLDVVEFLRRKVWARRDSLAVPFVCLEDLITMRKAVTGAKHVRRVRELEDLAR